MNKRVDDAVQAIEDNNKMLFLLRSDFSSTVNGLKTFWSRIVTAFAKDTLAITQIQKHYDNILTGVEELIHGNLSPFLVTHTILRNTLLKISDTIHDQFPQFQIVMTDLKYYYSTSLVIGAYH
jgi:hypothetical protein